jgi:hypothetical protein
MGMYSRLQIRRHTHRSRGRTSTDAALRLVERALRRLWSSRCPPEERAALEHFFRASTTEHRLADRADVVPPGGARVEQDGPATGCSAERGFSRPSTKGL